MLYCYTRLFRRVGVHAIELLNRMNQSKFLHNTPVFFLYYNKYLYFQNIIEYIYRINITKMEMIRMDPGGHTRSKLVGGLRHFGVLEEGWTVWKNWE